MGEPRGASVYLRTTVVDALDAFPGTTISDRALACTSENAALRDLVSNLEASCAELTQERDELRADRDALAFGIEEHRATPKLWDHTPMFGDRNRRLYAVLEVISSRAPAATREVGAQVSPTGAVPDRTPASAGAASSTSSEGAA